MSEISVERLQFESDGILLEGELYSSPGQDSLVVLCHGIPLARPDPSDGGYPELARAIAGSGYAVLVFNMRGTGGSGGNFSLGGWYRDVRAVMGHVSGELAERFPKCFIAGFSAGGALAIRYAAEHGGVAGVAAFAAPDRFDEIFRREDLFAFIEAARDAGIIRDVGFPPDPPAFYREIEESRPIDFVRAISPVPVLIVHGEMDETIPVSRGKLLYEAAGEPRELLLFPDGGHRLRRDPRVAGSLLDWLGRITSTA